MITHKQLTLAEVFDDCQNKFVNDKYQFLQLLDQSLNLDDIVPVSFVTHFYALTGRPRKFLLYPMIKALLIQRIFSIPTVTLLIIFLKFSRELRDFCGFGHVPEVSKFTRFKQDFLPDLQAMFDRMLDLIKPICQKKTNHTKHNSRKVLIATQTFYKYSCPSYYIAQKPPSLAVYFNGTQKPDCYWQKPSKLNPI